MWIPPTSNTVKLNCEASFKTLNAASGIVARNSVGSLITCFGKKWRCDSALAAELQAIRLACAFAANKGWFNAIIESNSQTAITHASTESVSPWALFALVMDIRYWVSHMKFQLLWTPCACNRVAHHVAKVVFSSNVNFTWDTNFPVEIRVNYLKMYYTCHFLLLCV
ncbi:ribonuclease H protein [Tanacetum coccineum]